MDVWLTSGTAMKGEKMSSVVAVSGSREQPEKKASLDSLPAPTPLSAFFFLHVVISPHSLCSLFFFRNSCRQGQTAGSKEAQKCGGGEKEQKAQTEHD